MPKSLFLHPETDETETFTGIQSQSGIGSPEKPRNVKLSFGKVQNISRNDQQMKSELVANASNAFDPSRKLDAAEKREKELYEKIGRLEIKLDFAKRVSEKWGIPIPEDD